MKNDAVWWVWLAEQVGQGSSLGVKLVNRFGSARAVFEAAPDDVASDAGASFNASELKRARSIVENKSTAAAEKIVAEAEKLGQRIVVPGDDDFPNSLKNLRDAPLALYVLGETPDFNNSLFVAVVGTRKMSDYGRDAAFSIGYGLASGGASVVSGMALGADSVAMTGAITAGGITVAVMGCGADVVYPKEHRDLYNAVLRDGCVISEYPPGTPVAGYNFPVRNRIISGLSASTVVIEANMQSGALITARHAAYQGRTVFAVPGMIGVLGAMGTNDLLKKGALVATSAEDVLAEYEFIFPRTVSISAARSALAGLDVRSASETAVERMRVSSRGSANYYGSGTYGGKRLPRGMRKDKEKAEGPVRMGDLADDLPAGFIRVKKDPSLAEPQRIDLDMLDETSIRVYNLMTPDVPVIADDLVKPDLPVSDILSSMSMLELAGAIEAGAGGYYLRRGSDDIGSFDPGEN